MTSNLGDKIFEMILYTSSQSPTGQKSSAHWAPVCLGIGKVSVIQSFKFSVSCKKIPNI